MEKICPTTGCTKEYAPVCAVKHAECITNGNVTACPTPGLPQVYNNICEASSQGAIEMKGWTIRNGQCEPYIINDDGMYPNRGM